MAPLEHAELVLEERRDGGRFEIVGQHLRRSISPEVKARLDVFSGVKQELRYLSEHPIQMLHDTPKPLR
jgi:hypothetical protein